MKKFVQIKFWSTHESEPQSDFLFAKLGDKR
jgi:hypothetical protein